MKTIPEYIERKLQVVLRHIEESAAFDGICGKDFNESTSVISLAISAGMSERSLREYFKAYIGQSLVSYVSSRRAEYAARILRLFPNVSTSKASYSIGFNCSNGIYGLMRRNGVENLDSLRGISIDTDTLLSFRQEVISECVLFYNQAKVIYEECSNKSFEAQKWDKIESYVKSKFPNSLINAYVGFAIDQYITDDKNSGTFISGILFDAIHPSTLDKDMIGDIGWRIIPSHRYAVFTHIGSYDGLLDFYEEVIATINKNHMEVDITIPFMEKYLNSPSDTSEEKLITELCVALTD